MFVRHVTPLNILKETSLSRGSRLTGPEEQH